MLNKKTLLLVFICLKFSSCSTSAPQVKITKKPDIIEVFACSDYCPAPEEQHMVKTYKDITNAADCVKIGGKPYEYVGWGKHFVCIAEE